MIESEKVRQLLLNKTKIESTLIAKIVIEYQLRVSKLTSAEKVYFISMFIPLNLPLVTIIFDLSRGKASDTLYYLEATGCLKNQGGNWYGIRAVPISNKEQEKELKRNSRVPLRSACLWRFPPKFKRHVLSSARGRSSKLVNWEFVRGCWHRKLSSQSSSKIHKTA